METEINRLQVSNPLTNNEVIIQRYMAQSTRYQDQNLRLEIMNAKLETQLREKQMLINQLQRENSRLGNAIALLNKMANEKQA